MDYGRRALLLGGAATFLAPRHLWAQSGPEGDHRPVVEAPALAEDPSAVPLQVVASHAMEPDHFIRSIDIRLDGDPIPHKGTFVFTPANGRAAVAFSMRSGVGGVLKVAAECSRHGRFVATREIRVTDGGCASPPDMTRDHLGSPRLRLPDSIRPGDIIQVRAKVDHNSYTGLVLKGGRYVREAPEFYVKQMEVFLDDQKISDFQLTSALSANPLLRFPVKAVRSGTLRVVFHNSEGQRWETAQRISV
jgi:predicted secreted protein